MLATLADAHPPSVGIDIDSIADSISGERYSDDARDTAARAVMALAGPLTERYGELRYSFGRRYYMAVAHLNRGPAGAASRALNLHIYLGPRRAAGSPRPTRRAPMSASTRMAARASRRAASTAASPSTSATATGTTG